MNFQEKYFTATKTEARRKIILELDRPKTIQEIAKDLNYDKTPAVSKLFMDLSEIGVTVCLTPERKRDRHYYLTEDGIKIRKILLGEEKFPL